MRFFSTLISIVRPIVFPIGLRFREGLLDQFTQFLLLRVSTHFGPSNPARLLAPLSACARMALDVFGPMRTESPSPPSSPAWAKPSPSAATTA